MCVVALQFARADAPSGSLGCCSRGIPESSPALHHFRRSQTDLSVARSWPSCCCPCCRCCLLSSCLPPSPSVLTKVTTLNSAVKWGLDILSTIIYLSNHRVLGKNTAATFYHLFCRFLSSKRIDTKAGVFTQLVCKCFTRVNNIETSYYNYRVLKKIRHWVTQRGCLSYIKRC